MADFLLVPAAGYQRQPPGWFCLPIPSALSCFALKTKMGMDQYLLIPFLGG